ncbi:MAG TPA: cyclase family protein [Vicinamibacterales bacterium]|jgi:kynurenine formamidase
MQTVLDLTQTIGPAMPVYPGTEPPVLRQANTVERNGFAETLLSMYSHTGTHVDAPAHMLGNAPTLDRLGVDHFVGRACVIDVSGHTTIEASTLTRHADLVAGCSFALLHTGWSRYWGQDQYFSGFAVLSADAARWLVDQGLLGVGFDAISADPVGADEFGNHLAFFRAGMILVENLTGLDALIGRTFLFSCLPLKFEAADGSPVRAVAILP